MIEYTVDEAGGGSTPDYTNGMSCHGVHDWSIHHNLFRNIVLRPGHGLAGPAVLVWNGSTNTQVIGNTFINNARDISLGLTERGAGVYDHEGGIIANNIIFRETGLADTVTLDVAIHVGDSPGTKVYHNTAIMNGLYYPNAIEYRYPDSANVDIRNNLTDAQITPIAGAPAAILSNNMTDASLTYFVDPAAWDFHLKQDAQAAIDNGVMLADVPLDIDNEARDANPDLGADEYHLAAAPVAIDDSYSTQQDVVLDVAEPGILANDSDVDTPTLTATLISDVSRGTLALNADGSFAYTPHTGFSGDDTFTYVANDGTQNSDTATVTITVSTAETSQETPETTTTSGTCMISTIMQRQKAQR